MARTSTQALRGAPGTARCVEMRPWSFSLFRYLSNSLEEALGKAEARAEVCISFVHIDRDDNDVRIPAKFEPTVAASAIIEPAPARRSEEADESEDTPLENEQYLNQLEMWQQAGVDEALRRADKTAVAIMDAMPERYWSDFELDLEELPQGAQTAIVMELANTEGGTLEDRLDRIEANLEPSDLEAMAAWLEGVDAEVIAAMRVGLDA